MASRRQSQLLAAGSRAPAFRLPTLEGGAATLDELHADRPVLLAFFKISCPVCQLTLPFLERLHAAGAIAVCAISQNDAEDTREFNRDFHLTLPTVLDTEDTAFAVSDAYGISSVPTMFLIERDGTIGRVFEGWQKREIEWLGLRAGTAILRQGENVPEWKAG